MANKNFSVKNGVNVGQAGPNAGFMDITANSIVGGYLWANHFNDGTDKNAIAGYSPLIQLRTDTGALVFYTSSLNSAGSALSVTERVRIDSAGNIGISAIPSEWRPVTKAIQVNRSAFADVVSGFGTALGNNWYENNASKDAYIGNDPASLYYQYSGTHEWYSAPSGTPGAEITWVPSMTLNANGNLGIGTDAPAAAGSHRVAEIKSSSATSGGMLIVSTADGSGVGRMYSTSTQLLLDDSGSSSDIYIKTNGPNSVLLGTNNIERMRIDSSGVVTQTSNNAEFRLTESGTYYGSIKVDSSGGLTIGSDPSNVAANSRLIFGVDGSERMRIDPAGNLLVGSTLARPTGYTGSVSTLTVAKSGSNSVLDVSTYSTNSNHASILSLGKSASDIVGVNSETLSNQMLGAVSFEGVQQGGGRAVGSSLGSVQTSTALSTGIPSALVFHTSNGVSLLERMRIDASGNVGIGTSNPVVTLAVTSGSNARVEFVPLATSTSIQSLNTTRTATTELASYGSVLTFNTGAAGSQAERMRVDSFGNVGIGTNAPGYGTSAGSSSGNGRTYLTVMGTSANSAGVIQLIANGAGQATNGILEFIDIGNTASSSLRAAFIYSGASGSTANNKGSFLAFATKADGVSGAGQVALVIDSNGNVCSSLGANPSAWGSSYRAIEIPGGAIWSGLASGAYTQLYLTNNAYYDGTNYIYKNTGYASNYAQNAGVHQWRTAPSGTAGAVATFSNNMTLDANGNLAVGTTSAYSAATRIHAQNASPEGVTIFARNTNSNGASGFVANDDGGTRFGTFGVLNTASTLEATTFGSPGEVFLRASSSAIGVTYASANNSGYHRFLVGSSANSERMRIDASGNVGIGTTVTYGGTGNTAVDGKLIVASPGADNASLFLPYPTSTYAGFKISHGALNLTGASDYTDLKIRPSFGTGIASVADVTAIRFVNTQPRSYPDVALVPFGGNVGVGTTTPTAKLDVNGISRSLNAREIKIAMGSADIDLSAGGFFTKTISGATTFTVSNAAPSGTSTSFILDLTNGGSAAITWWAGVKWAGGTAPTLTSSGRDVLGFFTHNGGTTWTGLLLGKDVK